MFKNLSRLEKGLEKELASRPETGAYNSLVPKTVNQRSKKLTSEAQSRESLRQLEGLAQIDHSL